MEAAVLRIFSGLHQGAEIELTEGVYVIGTDDSCDLILSDSSLKARHAALRVSCESGKIDFSVEPLDGNVSLNGTAILDERSIASLVPFQLGLLVAAWLPADTLDMPERWNEVEKRLTAKDAPRNVTAVSEPIPLDNGAGTEEATALEREGENPSLAAGEAQADSVKPKSKRGRDLCIIASMLLVGALCFSWNAPSADPTPAQIMRSLLDEAGYHKLNIVPGDRSITVTGRIATDRERGRLLKLAQLLDFPVYLEVTVHSDAADAVRASFNSLGLWPEVTELPPSSRPGVRVRGYIRNGFIEEMALSTTKRNVPSLHSSAGGKPELELFCEICHEDEVEAQLAPALMAAGLDDIQKVYLPGRIELRGTLTPQSKAALVEAAESVEKKLGVPIPFDIINEAEELRPKANIYTNQGQHAMQKENTSAPSSASFKVVSVSMGAMKFITLETGERVFEGGELPGGHILEHIDVEALTLKKNGKSINYPLRGSHE